MAKYMKIHYSANLPDPGDTYKLDDLSDLSFGGEITYEPCPEGKRWKQPQCIAIHRLNDKCSARDLNNRFKGVRVNGEKVLYENACKQTPGCKWIIGRCVEKPRW